MKPVKALGLLAVAALIVTALVGAPAANASTALCTVNEDPCATSNQATEVSFTAHNIEILSPLENKYSYGCESSLSATVSKLEEVQTLKAQSLTFSSCNKGCTRTTESLGTFSVARTGTEVAQITASGFVMKVNCSGFGNCVYAFEGQTGTLEGALLTEEGHITYFKAPLELVSGFLCPKEALFDALFEASEPIYVSS